MRVKQHLLIARNVSGLCDFDLFRDGDRFVRREVEAQEVNDPTVFFVGLKDGSFCTGFYRIIPSFTPVERSVLAEKRDGL